MAKTKQVRPEKERRLSPRIPASKVIPNGTMRLAAGQEVEFININADGGILIRSPMMLKPGSHVWLRLDIPGASATMGGHVRRCRIASIKHSKITWEAAILFDKQFPFPLDPDAKKFSEEPCVCLLDEMMVS